LYLSAQNIDTKPEIKYYKTSPNKMYKAALVYDSYMKWYAFAVYDINKKDENLIYITRVIQEFTDLVKFDFTKNNKYLIYKIKTATTQKEKHFHVYNLKTRINIECKSTLDLHGFIQEGQINQFLYCLNNQATESK